MRERGLGVAVFELGHFYMTRNRSVQYRYMTSR